MGHLEQIKDLLEGFELGPVKVEHILINSKGNVLLHIMDNGTDTWDENRITRLYQAIYDRITSELGPDVQNTVELGDYNVSGGVEGARVNVLSSSTNVMPAFVRHQFVLPVAVRDIPSLITPGHFSVPDSTPPMVDQIIKSLVAQRNVPKKMNHLYNIFKQGTMEVKTNENSLNTITVSYELPEHSHLLFKNVPQQNYRFSGEIELLPNPKDRIKIHIMDCEDFLKKTEGILDKGHLKTEFRRELLRAFEKHVKLHRFGLRDPLHDLLGIIRITGCEQLNTTDNG